VFALKYVFIGFGLFFYVVYFVAYAIEPPIDGMINSANSCIEIQKNTIAFGPTKVVNTCDTPVAFSSWFCGSPSDPCISKQDNRWNEDADLSDKRGAIYLLCPRGDLSWRDEGRQCLPAKIIWRTGTYAYGACHLSNERYKHWLNDIDINRDHTTRYVGDAFYWNDACERWLSKRTREIAETNESPLEENVFFDLSSPTLYNM
jgi:hypothetical protein